MNEDEGIIDSVRLLRRRTLAFVFGDRIGLLIFLASLCLFGLVWRTAFLINDSYTLANGLYALERGSLDMTSAVYGPALETPGANFYDGEIYARNYGALFAALPVVFLLKGLAAVADLRIVLVAVWCLLLLAAILLTGRILDRRRLASIGGSSAVLVLFVVNVVLATPLDPPQYHLLALQTVHLVGAAFVGVFTYRLVSTVHGRRLALLATILVTLGTPLAFWASVPKRHVLTAAVALAIAFAIGRSRDRDRSHATVVRASAYALVGLLAWVHAPEALVMFLALVAVDVPTAPSNDARTLAVVGGTLLLSLIPMFATNLAITGDPLTVPRALRSVSSGADVSLTGRSSGGSDVGGGGHATKSLPGFVLLALALFRSGIEPLVLVASLLADGTNALVRHPEHAYHAFVRSGYVAGVARSANDAAGANLSLLESAPVLAGLLALVPAAWTTITTSLIDRRLSARLTPVDSFVGLLALGYTLLYVASLPLHAQVTVRYLFPLYPLMIYGLVRTPSVRSALTNHWQIFAWTYASAVLVGGQLLLVTIVVLSPGRGEVFQFHALLALATAGLVALWALTDRTDGWMGRFGSTALGLATAAATTFVLFVSIEYYALGDSHALPMMRALADIVAIG